MNRIAFAVACCALSGAIGSAQEQQKVTIEALGGLSLPVSSAANEMKMGYNVLIGGGWNFTPSIAALLEFQYDHFGLTTGALKSAGQLAGFGRFWSFNVSPRYYFHRNRKVGGYATLGPGFYGREVAFTDPTQVQTYCDPYYGEGCESSTAPIVASNTNYKAGFNAGGGITYSPFGNRLKLVTDIRYNRFLSHANNSFMTMAVGFVY